MYELKPCPFCGGKVNLTYYSASNEFHVWHNWDNSAECPIGEPIVIPGVLVKSLEEAARAWNKRKDGGKNA